MMADEVPEDVEKMGTVMVLASKRWKTQFMVLYNDEIRCFDTVPESKDWSDLRSNPAVKLQMTLEGSSEVQFPETRHSLCIIARPGEDAAAGRVGEITIRLRSASEQRQWQTALRAAIDRALSIEEAQEAPEVVLPKFPPVSSEVRPPPPPRAPARAHPCAAGVRRDDGHGAELRQPAEGHPGAVQAQVHVPAVRAHAAVQGAGGYAQRACGSSRALTPLSRSAAACCSSSCSTRCSSGCCCCTWWRTCRSGASPCSG